MKLPKINFNEHVFDENSFFELIRSTEDKPRYVAIHLFGTYVVPVRVVDIKLDEEEDKFLLSCVFSTTLLSWNYSQDQEASFDIDFGSIDAITLY